MNSRKRLAAAAAIILILNFNLMAKPKRARKSPPPSENETNETWQTLEWDDETSIYVSRYDVVIESYSQKDGRYEMEGEYTTEGNETSVQLQPLLEPGAYRFKVISYDLLGAAATESDWMEFTIARAARPEVSSVSADITSSSTVFLEDANDGVFTVSGKNLYSSDKDSSPLEWTSYRLENAKKPGVYIIPEIIEADGNGRKVKMKVDMAQLDAGEWRLSAVDASGLTNGESSSPDLTVKFRKLVDFDVSVDYSMALVIHDDTMETYTNAVFWPLGGKICLTLMPFKRRSFYLGAAIDLGYSRVSGDMTLWSSSGNFFSGHANFVCQIPFRNKKGRHTCTLDFHAGAGLGALAGFKFSFDQGGTSPKLDSIGASFDVGAAAHIYMFRRVYAELRVDYDITLLSDMVLGRLNPSAGIGCQF